MMVRLPLFVAVSMYLSIHPRSHGTEIKNRISARLWNENQKSKINFHYESLN